MRLNCGQIIWRCFEKCRLLPKCASWRDAEQVKMNPIIGVVVGGACCSVGQLQIIPLRVKNHRRGYFFQQVGGNYFPLPDRSAQAL